MPDPVIDISHKTGKMTEDRLKTLIGGIRAQSVKLRLRHAVDLTVELVAKKGLDTDASKVADGEKLGQYRGVDLIATDTPEEFQRRLFDALRIVACSHYEGEELGVLDELEEADPDRWSGVSDWHAQDLFDRGLLVSFALGDTGEYGTRITAAGRKLLTQVLGEGWLFMLRDEKDE